MVRIVHGLPKMLSLLLKLQTAGPGPTSFALHNVRTYAKVVLALDVLLLSHKSLT